MSFNEGVCTNISTNKMLHHKAIYMFSDDT